MADDRVVAIDMAKDQAGADVARAVREGVKGLPLVGGIVQTTDNDVWPGTIAAWRAAGALCATYAWPAWGNPETEGTAAGRANVSAGATGGVMLDLEGPVPDGVNVSSWSGRFLAAADAAIGRPGAPSFFYSTRGWVDEHGVSLPGRRFVVAAYGDDRTDPDVPEPDDGAVLWQFTQHGRAPGFDGDVDLNVGHRAQVIALLGGEEDQFMPDARVTDVSNEALTKMAKAFGVGDAANNLLVKLAAEMKRDTDGVIQFMTAVVGAKSKEDRDYLFALFRKAHPDLNLPAPNA